MLYKGTYSLKTQSVKVIFIRKDKWNVVLLQCVMIV